MTEQSVRGKMASLKYMFCFSSFVFAAHLSLTSAKIIGSFIMPHGGIALDPRHFNTTNSTAKKEGWEIHNACIKVGQVIEQLKPDVIFLSTPHGVADLKNFIFYLNPVGKGFADTDNCQCPPCCYNVTVKFDTRLSSDIVNALGTEKNVSGLAAFGPPEQSSEPFPLRWGEVIPLHFIPSLNNTKVVVISQPSRRYTEDVSMIPELLKLGSDLFHLLESGSGRVVVVVSGDLAHTHQASGPYGYSNASEPFDQACGLWVRTLDKDTLVKTAAHYVDKALSCGYTGFVMLHGLMSAAAKGTAEWASSLLVNYHPSYYGMMVAQFIRRAFCNNDSEQKWDVCKQAIP